MLRVYYYSVKQLILMVCVSIFTIITTFALSLFNPYSPSLFYATSHTIHGWWYLTSYAGLLYYVFGGAAWLIVLLSCFFLYHLFFQLRLTDEWERYVIVLLAFPVVSWVLSLSTIDCAHGFNPGGFVGKQMFFYVSRCNPTLWYAGMCWYGITAMSMLGRGMVIKPVVILQHILYHFIQLLQKYKVVQKILALCSLVYQYCMYTPIIFVSRVIMHGYHLLFKKKAVVNNNVVNNKENNTKHSPLYESLHKDLHSIYQKEETFIESQEIEHNEYNVQKEDVLEQKNELNAQYCENDGIDYEEVSYELPSLEQTILSSQEKTRQKMHDEQELRARALEDKLQKFGVKGTVVNMSVGPVVTLFEYQPESDIKLSKILTLEDDLAMAMQALSIRILAPIPGTSVVGFEVANSTRCDVLLRDVINSSVYKNFQGQLPIILGKDTTGESIVVDLVKMPHLLVAGSTGSGKSVALNAMLVSMLCKLHPDQLKLILIDPKRLEFASYADIAHLEFPIITDPKKAVPVLRWVVQQMEERYEYMAQSGVRNFADYNIWLKKNGQKELPLLVVVIDELADLMLSVGRDIEDLITRIAQMARAAGIHLIVATQRPSVDVITGLIKANFPSRISFRVSSRIDSRTILDTSGAEKLLGKGDMLFIHASSAHMDRIHGAFVSDQEIDFVVEHIRAIRTPSYRDLHLEIAAQENAISDEDDELYQEICAFLETIEEVSISLLQRKFRIGYNRSARIIDLLESHGKIMPPDGGKTRKVIPQ